MNTAADASSTGAKNPHSTLTAATAVRPLADVLAIGFGMTVSMWAVGYVCRMPPAFVPSWLVLVLMATCQVAGGVVAGRYAGRGLRGGLYAGLGSGLVNLLILGSLLTTDQPNRIVPSALAWVPGSILAAGVLGAIGALFGTRMPARTTRRPNWISAFATVAVGATFLLIIAGGLVTGHDAGLAVVDWPNSFGYNMFLYPLSRMTGGIYYEHAHRLFGSLVGLTTMVLAIHLQWADNRMWVRRFALLCLAVVIIQGVLGGLRITGRFTLSTSPQDTAPNLTLAVVHGVLAQLFLGLVVSLAVFTSRGWRSTDRIDGPASTAFDRRFTVLLVLALVTQLVFGALLRHRDAMLALHVGFAAVVAALAIHGGVRAWGSYSSIRALVRSGPVLVFGTIIQLFLGLFALVVTRAGLPIPKSVEAIVTTLHQATGAGLLAAAVVVMLWTQRVFVSAKSNRTA